MSNGLDIYWNEVYILEKHTGIKVAAYNKQFCDLLGKRSLHKKSKNPPVGMSPLPSVLEDGIMQPGGTLIQFADGSMLVNRYQRTTAGGWGTLRAGTDSAAAAMETYFDVNTQSPPAYK